MFIFNYTFFVLCPMGRVGRVASLNPLTLMLFRRPSNGRVDRGVHETMHLDVRSTPPP